MLLSIDSSDAAMPAMLEAALRRSGLALLKLATRALPRDARLLISSISSRSCSAPARRCPTRSEMTRPGGFWCRYNRR
jgi:hypothetical protein